MDGNRSAGLAVRLLDHLLKAVRDAATRLQPLVAGRTRLYSVAGS